jgi:NH3-dependent NAD+ synthetase
MIKPDKSYFPFLAGEENKRRQAEKTRGQTYNYISTNKLQSLALSISGGIDSTLCAALLSKLRQGNMKARMRMMVLYNLATYLLGKENEQQKAAMQSCIDASLVDGLGSCSCDCEQLGVENYFEADRIFAAYFQGDESLREHTLIKLYYSSEYKRHNPACLSREKLIS